MNNFKKYVKPTAEVDEFCVEDIITASAGFIPAEPNTNDVAPEPDFEQGFIF